MTSKGFLSDSSGDLQFSFLYALKYLKEHEVIHCDLKTWKYPPKDPTKSGIKIIDFGSSCF